LGLFSDCFKGGTPCHVVIQNWILRFGLYKLRQAPEKRGDWVYILDHTIESGAKKCLVVLGISLARFRALGCEMKHTDMEVLAISVVEKATAASVTEVLRDTARSTGVPVQIISDKGGNIRKGIGDFIAEMKGSFTIRQTYDVTHRAALILKRHLKNDEVWKSFVEAASKTKRSLLHTILAYIAPSKPRDKARWLNLEAHVKWGEEILGMPMKILGKNEWGKYKDSLLWVRRFREPLLEWRTILDMLDALKSEVKLKGFNADTKARFEERVSNLNLNTRRLVRIKSEIIEYIEEECKHIDGVYPGCSDIIESILGKYKSFSGKGPMKEIGKAVLTMPVFTSDISYKEVKMAMESISASDLQKWLDDNLGKSLFSKRKGAFSLKKRKSSVRKSGGDFEKVAGF